MNPWLRFGENVVVNSILRFLLQDRRSRISPWCLGYLLPRENSAESDISKQEIKDRQKDVVSDVGSLVMAHVIGTGKAKTGGQPAI